MSEPELTGRTLSDRYRIDQKLGQGGMATAWLAFDLRLTRQVVVKIPLAELLRDETAVQRFQLEIESLIRLQHPHIVHVLDAGVVDGRPFAVLEYLEGGSLDERLERAGGSMSAAETLEWLPRIAEALDHVHEEGMIHRDVKPGNILFDAKGHPALSDFGIVKALVSAPTGLTMTGQSPGSPRYMAPEVLGGRIGPAYDQYSLAAVAYRCLTGTAPEPLQTHVHLLRDSAGRLPLPAISVLQMALSPAPEARFPSCAQFVSALGEALHEDIPIATVDAGVAAGAMTGTYFVPSRPPAAAPEKAPTRRSPLLPVLAALLILAGAGVAWHFLTREPTVPAGPEPDPRVAIRFPEGALPTLTNLEFVEVRGRIEGDENAGLLLDGRHVRCDRDGSFGCRLPLEEGRNRFSLTAEDRNGRVVGEKEFEIVRHSGRPLVRLEPVAALTNSRRIEITGVVIDEFPGEVRVAGRQADLLADGGFRILVDLTEGRNQVTVEALDAAGNRADPIPVEVTLDVEPPVIRIPGGREQYSANREFVVRGSLEDAYPGSVMIDGRPAEMGSEGSFSGPVPLGRERTEITVSARDRAGNQAPVQRVTLILDEVPPVIEVEEPTDGSLTRRPECDIRVRLADAHPAGVRIGGREAEREGDGRFRATLDLDEGENEIEIVGTDRAGNEARARTTRILDSHPPVLRLGPAESIGSRLWIRGRVTDERPSHVVVEGARVELAPDGTFETIVDLAEPGTVARVEAHDLAGNRSPVREVAATSMAAGPEVTLEPTPERTRATAVTIAGRVAEDDVTITIGGRGTRVKDRAFSLDVELAVGENTIVVTARDRRGAESRFEVRVHRDPAETPPPAQVVRAIRQLASSDPGERFFAATQLGRAGHAAAAEPLEITLRDAADPMVRRAAARSLGQIGAWRSIPALIETLAATEPLVASDAHDALRLIASREFGWRPDLTGERLQDLLRSARAWWEDHRAGPGD